MDLEFTAEERAFRAEVRAFLEERVPRATRDKVLAGRELGREDYLEWQRRLHERGWGGVSWPLQFGGTGWNAVQQYIFEEESALAGAPRLIPFGTQDGGAGDRWRSAAPRSSSRFLPKISSAETWWCQGYSEPGAGSDLASLRTRAVREGDQYVVNGQKTWNTLGQFADWIFCLVRTDPQAKQQSGISFLLDRHEESGHHGAADRAARRRPRGQRDLVRGRAGAGGEPRRRGKPRLDLRQVLARPRAHQHRRHRRRQARACTPEARRGERTQGWTAALRRSVCSPRRSRESRSTCSRSRSPICACCPRRAPRARRVPRPPFSRSRVPRSSKRISELLMRAAGAYALPLRREAMEAGWQPDPTLAAPGPRYTRHGHGRLPQSTQAVDLRRHQRDSKEHHRQDGRTLVAKMADLEGAP